MGTSPDQMSYRERRAERARLLSTTNDILDGAQAQGRDLSAQEQIAFDALQAQLQHLQASPVNITSKADLVDLLRDSGLARAAAERVAAGGFDALQQDAAIFNLSAQIKALTKSLTEKP